MVPVYFTPALRNPALTFPNAPTGRPVPSATARCSTSASTADDIVGPAAAAEDVFGSYSLAPSSGARLRQLADLDVATLALMHGPAFTGDCSAALLGLADDLERRTATAAV
jgi:hypothetical protein